MKVTLKLESVNGHTVRFVDDARSRPSVILEMPRERHNLEGFPISSTLTWENLLHAVEIEIDVK